MLTLPREGGTGLRLRIGKCLDVGCLSWPLWAITHCALGPGGEVLRTRPRGWLMNSELREQWKGLCSLNAIHMTDLRVLPLSLLSFSPSLHSPSFSFPSPFSFSQCSQSSQRAGDAHSLLSLVWWLPAPGHKSQGPLSQRWGWRALRHGREQAGSYRIVRESSVFGFLKPLPRGCKPRLLCQNHLGDLPNRRMTRHSLRF